MATKSRYLPVARFWESQPDKQPNGPALFVEPLDPMLLPGLASSVNALIGGNLESSPASLKTNPWPISTAMYPNPASSISFANLSRILAPSHSDISPVVTITVTGLLSQVGSFPRRKNSDAQHGHDLKILII
ncbi:hypothetical protein MMC31_007706 [Peltigera leucophlebia]|nr:hypothetical protein [Peltigera leucophlebia]